MMTTMLMWKRWYVMRGRIDNRSNITQVEVYRSLLDQRIKLDPKRLP